jgi:hypothetical protein
VTGKSSKSPSKRGKKSPTKKKFNRKVLQHEVNDANAASQRYGGGSDSDSGLSTGRSSQKLKRKAATPSTRELKAWQNTLDRNDVLVLKTKAAILIQKLFRGWRVRAEFVELMRPLIVVQHPYRDGINFRTWRFALITLAANRIIRAQRYAWGVRAARKARALAWALHIKSANGKPKPLRFQGWVVALIVCALAGLDRHSKGIPWLSWANHCETAADGARRDVRVFAVWSVFRGTTITADCAVCDCVCQAGNSDPVRIPIMGRHQTRCKVATPTQALGRDQNTRCHSHPNSVSWLLATVAAAVAAVGSQGHSGECVPLPFGGQRFALYQ